MKPIYSRCRGLLVGSIAAGVLSAASPASATLYVLNFTTSSQTGQIYLIGPDWTKPGALPGTITAIEIVNSYETTVGANFNHSGVKQRIQSIVPIGGFKNAFLQLNDNKLETFSNTNSTTPASSTWNKTPATEWFSYGGFAVTAYNGTDSTDATILDIFVKPPVRLGGLPTFEVESFDKSGHAIVSPGTGILSVPTPALAGGFMGLSGLGFGGITLWLRRRLAAR
jgi:hypothetical protein